MAETEMSADTDTETDNFRSLNLTSILIFFHIKDLLEAAAPAAVKATAEVTARMTVAVSVKSTTDTMTEITASPM